MNVVNTCPIAQNTGELLNEVTDEQIQFVDAMRLLISASGNG